MDQNRVWALMARQLAGEATEEDLEELRAVLERHPDWQYTFDLTHHYWHLYNKPDRRKLEQIDVCIDRIVAAGLSELPSEPVDEAEPEVRFGFRRRYRMVRALGLVLLAGAGLTGWLVFRNSSPAVVATVKEKNRVVTHPGTRSHLLLPDGSSVWLNAGSELSYSTTFQSDEREVYLKGEAFFDVAKDVRHPFIVHTSSIDVRVLGTSFNVKAYQHDKTVEATLLKGAIEVIRKDVADAPRILLKPDEKLIWHIVSSEAGAQSISAAQALKSVEVESLPSHKTCGDVAETAWMFSRLEFHGDSFEELAKKMERWYNVSIIFSNDRLKEDRFNGSFEKENVFQALDALQLTAKFTYKIKNNVIEIKP